MPLGPETPQTRIREIIIEGLSLYQLAGPPAKPVADLKSSKPLKNGFAWLDYGIGAIFTFFSALSRRPFSRIGHSLYAFPPGFSSGTECPVGAASSA